MARAEPAGAESWAFGPISVRADEEAVARYCRETGFDAAAGVVPAAFPAVWLTAPEIHAAIAQELDPDFVPVHESQSFEYSARLARGESYALSITWRREEQPARLILNAKVTALSGEPCLRIETWLRIVPRSQAGSA